VAGRLIENVCRRFSSALASGQQLSIESLLQEIPEDDRKDALLELLRIELGTMRDAGEPFDPQHYHQRFPTYNAAVAEVMRELDARKIDDKAGSPFMIDARS
jgi:hypothetical protein